MADLTKSASFTPASTLGLSLRDYTSARLSLGRIGVSLATSEGLAFQLAHAQARDAVHAALDVEGVSRRLCTEDAGLSVLSLTSAAADRATYLRRPDLGRRLDSASAGRLGAGGYDVVFVIADGLSATAVERHAIPLFSEVLRGLPEGWRVAPVCVVKQGRVGIGDEIGSLFGTRLSVVLIGERPGLSSPDSLGAYITWDPRLGRVDAERNCVSNVHGKGLSYEAAAARILFYCTEARRLELSGTRLKEMEPGLLSI
ncbi:ethanolamine ammonia-lyase subunit EutC [Granulicella sp. L60]|uniref:ethanolamine ammonia-lyase subunit EutC n=1 Tax=Granulicella sp. L60 TaxID=1641866 RepID=UPI00131A666C|nr:ethanolamine ammonia-lyase subunit EutC [Granulicella sp. L60]